MPIPIPDDELIRVLGRMPPPTVDASMAQNQQPALNPALLQQPTTIPIPIKPDQYLPIQPGPAQSNLAAMHAPVEQPISRGRRAMAAIGGGFAGFSSPKSGIETAQEILHGPYNREVEAYQRRLDLAKTQAGEESKLQEEGIKRGTGESNVQYKQGELGVKTGELGVKQAAQKTKEFSAENLAAHRNNLNDLNNWKMTHPKQDDIQWAYEVTDPVERQSRLDFIKLEKEAQRMSDEDAAKRAGLIAGKQAEARDQVTISPLGQRAAVVHPAAAIAAGGTPEALKAEEDKTKATTTGRVKAETDPEMIARQAQLAHAKSVALVSMNEKDTAHSAQIALTRFPDIEAALPKASDKMFGNRWNDFLTGTLGQDPEFAPLRTDIGMLQSLVAKIHIGSRGSSHIMQKFEGLFNAKAMDRDTLSASLKEIKKWIEVYSKMPNVQGDVDLGDVDKAVENKGKKSIFDSFTPIPTGGKQ